MKILCCSLVALLFAFSASADTWDCMTKEEALAVETLLTEKMPYLLDYCDCCEADANLVHVRNVQVVPCEYEEGMYTVEITGDLLAVMPYTGGAFETVIPADSEGVAFETTVSLNYSFGVNGSGEAKTISAIIDAETWNGEPCQEEVAYPDPELVANEAYTSWFQKLGLK